MEKMATIYFQSEVNLICTVLHINLIYTFVCIFAVNLIRSYTQSYTYICLFLLLYYNLCVSNFVPSCEENGSL